MFKLSIAAILLACASATALAEGSAITVYGGFRNGGGFTDSSTGEGIDVDSSGAGAIALDLPYDGGRQLQLFASHQRSDLKYTLVAAPKAPSAQSLPFSVTYLHVGGTNFFDGTLGTGGYVVGGLGASVLSVDGDGYDAELFPSLNLGLGYQYMLGKNLSLRAEGRVYATLINSSGGLFCSGGCLLSIQGDLFTQGEVMLGVSAHF